MPTKTLDVLNLLGEPRDYEDIWQLQRDIHAEVVAGNRPGTLILVEHSPVFTAGKRTRDSDRPTDGSKVFDVDRGGRITWHGPGQLVGYPIVHLPEPFDVVAFVRRLENGLAAVCSELGLSTITVEGRSGVWVPATTLATERKVAAIGCRVARSVTMHGFAINANPDLSWYQRIVPCGIDDAGVTSLSLELNRTVTVEEIAEPVQRHVIENLEGWAQ